MVCRILWLRISQTRRWHYPLTRTQAACFELQLQKETPGSLTLTQNPTRSKRQVADIDGRGVREHPGYRAQPPPPCCPIPYVRLCF